MMGLGRMRNFSHWNFVGMRWNGFHNGLKAVDGICSVRDGPDAPVRIDKRILALDHVAVSSLGVGLLVARERVTYAIFVLKTWPCLVSIHRRSLDEGGLSGHRGRGLGDGTNGS